jgi:fatty acid desaturase
MSRSKRNLLADLHEVRPAIYWSDFLLTTVGAWASFALAVSVPVCSVGALLAATAALFLFYRALCFIHEISHHSEKLRGFEVVWNALIGFPMLLPAFTYREVHLDHHRLTKYGTDADPEYLPFARSAALTAWFGVSGLFLPLLLAFRFLILGPLGLVFPPIHRWLVECAWPLTMNPHFQREATPETIRRIRRDSFILLLLWILALGLLAVEPNRLRVIVTWLTILGLISFVNNLRTLSAHAYESSGQPMDKACQVADSIDVPGGIWTELWAPIGLRYHAIHHDFPGIPYHALPHAYRRLVEAMPETYGRMTRLGLFHCLRSLYLKGRGASF